MKNIRDRILEVAPQHGSLPFWSWNDRLEEQELRRQIRHMKSLGMRGFFMHARGGLETKYLSQEWFDAVRACIDEAKKLGMEAWAYDENGWPSGFAGGELLKDPANQACGLYLERVKTYPAASDDILGVYVQTANGVRFLQTDEPAEEYLVIYRERDFSYVDTMNAEVTRQFLTLTHERYQTEIDAADFGHTMPGFFSDEPQYFRYGTPWSDQFPKRFQNRFGYDIYEGLPALFINYAGAEEFRYDYHLLCHECFYSDFMKPVYDWCETHRVKLTGHGIEEWGLGGQMMCCGGIMPFYLYQHLPGIDYLGRAIKNISGAKQLGSVCAQSGKSVALSEMFACCGWDVSPKELKRIAELQFAGGVNLICEHLYAYSERGQRKRDFPNHYSEHNPWSKSYGDFERHFQHLGAALSLGEEVADTLVLHPIRSAYLHYKHTVHHVGLAVAGNDESGIDQMESDFDALVRLLSRSQLPYHFGDESVIKELGGYVAGNRLFVGACSYSRVLLPNCETLDSNTVSLLKEFVANGGDLVIYGSAPTRIDGRIANLSFLRSTMTFEDLIASSGIRVQYQGKAVSLEMQMRRIENRRLIFLANTSSTSYKQVEITLEHADGLCLMDIDTLVETPLQGRKNTDGSATVWVDFPDSASCLLLESDSPMLEPKAAKSVAYLSLPEQFKLQSLPENKLLLEHACLSFDGIRFTEPRPITRIRDELLRARYKGAVTLRFSFETDSILSDLKWIAEPLQEMKAAVNGALVEPMAEEWRIDRRFLVYDLVPHLKCGENTLDLCFPYIQREEVYHVFYGGGNEALRNCLCFDTEPEAVYLFGHFRAFSKTEWQEDENGILRTNGPFTLYEQTDDIDLYNINCSGYPHFAGDMTAEWHFSWHQGEATAVRLDGRYATVGLTVNGTDLGDRLFCNVFDLSEHLTEGENQVSVRLCFSNRNLLGPHHTAEGEPLFVTPRTFSFEKQWKDGECANYHSTPAYVRFGLDKPEKEQIE